MKCPECEKEGERSCVYDLGGRTTLMGWMPFYDEDGRYHSHDLNETTHSYRCSRGHYWEVTSPPPVCAACLAAEHQQESPHD
jgi:hypothetical protein